MSRWDDVRAWVTATRPRTVAVVVGGGIAAVAAGVALSMAIGAIRDTDEVASGSSASPSILAASESAEPSESPSPTATPSPTPSPSATPAATPEPTAAATPGATALPTPTPAPTPADATAAVHWPLGMDAMTIVEGVVVRSRPGTGADATPYAPALPDRTRFRLVEGPVLASGYWWYRVTDISATLDGGVSEGWVASGDLEQHPWIGPSPEGCADLPFPSNEISISTLSELEAGMARTWGGCVTTPWIDPYPVIVTFRADGTYSARTLAEGEFVEPAFYYGTDDDSPQKLWAVNDLQDSLKGVGQIDIVFWEDNINRGELRNITLMGSQLEFEFFHRGQYGPLEFRLFEIGPESAWSPS